MTKEEKIQQALDQYKSSLTYEDYQNYCTVRDTAVDEEPESEAPKKKKGVIHGR